MASSILAITGNDLPFASLGGKYPRLGLNQLGYCHARHTKKEIRATNWVARISLRFMYGNYHYFTSSKTTLTDYQCVSTGCCTHVAKTGITIDNQHVTNITAKVQISPQITKRKHRKNHKPDDFS
jgi:hypothetical protein